MPPAAKTVPAIFAVFFLESAVLGNWIPRIPDIKATLQLTDSVLGLCLLAIPLGTILGLIVAGRVIDRTGLRGACRIFLPLWALLFVLPAFAQSALQLGISLLLCGLAVGLIEVGMNTEADRIERAHSIRIMSRCHGFWSLGSMAGALCGAVLAQTGVSVVGHFLAIMPLIAVAGWYASSQLPELTPEEHVATQMGSESTSTFCLPTRAILLLCLMPIGIMAVEGAFIDWSAVFMRTILDASPLLIGITYSFFSGVMAITRLFGDSIAHRYGDLNVVRASGLAATLGIVLFALSPNALVAFIAAVLAGGGVAIVYPLAVSAAAQRPGRSAADNVASLTMVAFGAFLLAPPIIGFLSDAWGLRWALLALAPLVFTTVLLAGEVRRQPLADTQTSIK